MTPCAWLSCALCLCTQDVRTVRKGKLLLQLWCLLQLIVSGIRVYSAVETCEDRVDGAETDRCERQWQAGLIASICSAFAAAVSTLALCAALWCWQRRMRNAQAAWLLHAGGQQDGREVVLLAGRQAAAVV